MVFPGLEGQDIVTARLDIGLFREPDRKVIQAKSVNSPPAG